MADEAAPVDFDTALAALADEIARTQQRTVPTSSHTLGGKRMRGERPMTPQERTMADNPALQMGRDAGAFASRGINAAGLGLPGIIVNALSPEAGAAIRENEDLANPGVGAVGSGVGMLGASGPLNALGKGAGAAWRAFSEMPALVKGGTVAAPVLATPTEAAKDVKPKDYEPRGLGSELMGVAKQVVGLGGAPDAERPLSQDEFRAQRRQLQPKSRSDYIESEVDKVRNLPSYQDAGQKQRTNMENSARSNAEKLYSGYQQDVTDEGKRIDKEYGDYVEGWKKQRQEYIDKPFAERHPTAATVMTWGAPVLSAFGTRLGLKAINQKGVDIAEKGATAAAGNDMRGVADAIIKADKYAPRAAAGRAAVIGESAALPVELRAAADYADKKTLPSDSKAQQAAASKLSLENLPGYMGGMALDFGSGLIGAGSGALYNKIRGPSPGVDLAALRQNAAGIPRNGLSQDQLAIPLMDRAKARIAAESELNALASSANKPIPLTAEPATKQLPPPASPGGQGGQPPAGPAGPSPGPQGGTPNQQPAAGASKAASSNLPSWAGEPPPGVKLPKDTYWDVNRNQPRHRDGTYVEMPKYRHPKSP